MTADDLYDYLDKRPFEPFQIQVSDGTLYHIKHPELVMVGVGSISVGVPAVGPPPTGPKRPVYQRVITISLQHVVKLLPAEAKEAGTKG
jgi:hypothetical protein